MEISRGESEADVTNDTMTALTVVHPSVCCISPGSLRH